MALKEKLRCSRALSESWSGASGFAAAGVLLGTASWDLPAPGGDRLRRFDPESFRRAFAEKDRSAWELSRRSQPEAFFELGGLMGSMGATASPVASTPAFLAAGCVGDAVFRRPAHPSQPRADRPTCSSTNTLCRIDDSTVPESSTPGACFEPSAPCRTCFLAGVRGLSTLGPRVAALAKDDGCRKPLRVLAPMVVDTITGRLGPDLVGLRVFQCCNDRDAAVLGAIRLASASLLRLSSSGSVGNLARGILLLRETGRTV